MRRILIALGVLAILGALIGGLWLERASPGSDLVVRRGDRVSRADSWAVVLPGANPCELPTTEDGQLAYQLELEPIDRQGALWPLRLSFAGGAPEELDPSWPPGSYCDALQARLTESATAWLRTLDPDLLRSLEPAAVTAAWSEELASLGFAPIRLRASLTTAGAEVARAIPAVVESRSGGAPLWVIGLDGGDWKLLDRLIADGTMPNLGRLVAEGRSGILLSEAPPLSPLLWTTMVTGVSPLEHGILDFSRFRLSDGSKEPISAAERRVPALWNITSWAGLPTVQLGLWATFPAEAVAGISVSDRFFGFLFTEDEPPRGAVYPPDRDGWARQVLEEVDAEVDLSTVQDFAPWLDTTTYAEVARSKNPYEHPIGALRRVLVETRVYDRLFREAVASIDPVFAMVYIQGTDTIGHTFASYAPPRQPHVSERDFERYSEIPRRYFAEVDAKLGAYRELAAAKNASLLLVSDHGFLWDEGRPQDLSSFAVATAAKWHREEGMYLLWGPGVQPSTSRTRDGAPGLRSVAASSLALLGLPAGRAMEQDLLPGLSAPSAGVLDYQQHYSPIGAAEETSGEVGEEELAELRALGYVGAGEAATRPEGAERSPLTAGWYNNQGLILRDEKKDSESRTAFEKAIELDPNLASALWNLSDMLHAGGELERADELLVRAFTHGLPRGTEFLVGRAIGYQRSGMLERSLRLLEGAAQAGAVDPPIWLFLGRYRTEAGDCPGAVAAFERALELAPDEAPAWASLGIARLCLQDRAGAEAAFRRSLELDPNQPRLRQMLAAPTR